MNATDDFPTSAVLPPVTGLRFRHLRLPDDYAAMTEMANASRLAEGSTFITTVEEMANFYSHLTNCDLARDAFAVEVEGRLAGYARTEWYDTYDGERIHEVVCFLEPARRRLGIGRAMLRTLEGRVRELAGEAPAGEAAGSPPRFLQSQAEGKDVGREVLLRSEGFEPVRYGFTMVRPDLEDQHDAPLPEGLEIREVRPEHLRAIWEADAEAFRDHWGMGPPTEADYQEFLTDPMTNDTTLWRIAWDGDQVAGQVRSFINEEENRLYGRERGWVESISVRRPWRHRGLARALIAASFPLLRARGMTEGALGVDTENLSGALRIYESMGFRAVSKETTFRKRVA
ncbi:MAG TPA: GNAT family N-acetyltransferase [Candidatus Dormibacteraeota bacterium]|nr:GNAT family N-acetyltransferase [Candidatus Dormibacteraeota bacterium]